jgi:hypothetical protein
MSYLLQDSLENTVAANEHRGGAVYSVRLPFFSITVL